MEPTTNKSLFDILFGPTTRLFAVVALVLSFWLPADGFPIQICWVQNLFHLPCPGCGLTRSVTCISQIQFAKAWSYHPFGFLVYLLLLANVLVMGLSTPAKARLRNMMDSRGIGRACYLIIVGLFLTYGLHRMWIHAQGWSNNFP